MQVKLHYPSGGGYGHLWVRRPGPVKRIQTWRTVRLGDELRDVDKCGVVSNLTHANRLTILRFQNFGREFHERGIVFH